MTDSEMPELPEPLPMSAVRYVPSWPRSVVEEFYRLGVETERKERGWISVEDRLPAVDSGEVLVWLNIGSCAVDEWITYREDPLGLGGPAIETGCGWRSYEFEDIACWQPLPSPPAQEDKHD